MSLQYLSRSSLHRLSGLPCRLFLSCGLQVVTGEVHRMSLMRLICPAQDHYMFLTVYIMYMTFVLSLTKMLFLLYVYVMLSILLSILVCAAASLFRCLFGQCLGLYTICHSWQHTGVVHLSLQADGKVPFKDIPVFGVYRPACHNPSLYLLSFVVSQFFSLRL